MGGNALWQAPGTSHRRKVIEGFQSKGAAHDSASAEQALLISQKLEKLASRIDSIDWSATVQLHSLSKAIKENNIAIWTNVDIYQLIDLDKIVERFRNQPLQENFLLRMLRTLRLMLSFAPFIFIIFDIVNIINAYQRIAMSDYYREVEQTPFLLLWEEGFHGRLAPIAEPSTALMIILMFVVLILMTTLMISATFGKLEVKKKADMESLRKEMITALTDTSQYLQLHV